LFERNRETGIWAGATGTTLELTDVVVRDTRSQEGDGLWGRGLEVTWGARAEVHRALFERNGEFGVFAGMDAWLALTDLVVRATREAECGRTTCLGEAAGTGLYSGCGAHLEARRFAVSDSVLCGVQLAHGSYLEDTEDEDSIVRCDVGGTMDLHEGVVSHNPIAVNVQTEGFDIYRLADRVIYRDNGINLDMAELPVPSLGIPFGDEP
jgi:hypothetical protein